MTDPLAPDLICTIRSRYATEAISQPDLAADLGISIAAVNKYLTVAVNGDGDVADIVTVDGASTVLKYNSRSNKFHLPTDDWVPLCGEKRSEFWEKERAVLPWYECCEKCARNIVARGAHLTTADVTLDSGGDDA